MFGRDIECMAVYISFEEIETKEGNKHRKRKTKETKIEEKKGLS
jgi:hypothetical protein